MEYRVLTMVSSEITWIWHIIRDLQIVPLTPTLVSFVIIRLLLQLPLIQLFVNVPNIEIDCHFLHEKIDRSPWKLLPIRSSSKLANMFTKALCSATLQQFLVKMDIFGIHCPSWGDITIYVFIFILYFIITVCVCSGGHSICI